MNSLAAVMTRRHGQHDTLFHIGPTQPNHEVSFSLKLQKANTYNDNRSFKYIINLLSGSGLTRFFIEG